MHFSNNELAFAEKLLQNNIRLDGRREPFQTRQTRAEFLAKPGTLALISPGHLLFYQGSTTILVKTTAEITSPRNERPS